MSRKTQPSTLQLVLIRGFPGSGKSTLARGEYAEYLHYEPDHLFCDTRGRYRFDLQLWDEACNWTFKMTDFALARNESVVVSDVFTKVADIERYERLAKAHGAEFIVRECVADFGNIHNVPVTVIEMMKAEYQPYEAAIIFQP